MPRTLPADGPVLPVAEVPVEPVHAALTEEEVRTIAEAKRISLIDYMRDYLAGCPKRIVKIHNDADVFVQINGYSLLIQPGVSVPVPEPVAVLLDEAGYI